MFLQQLQTSVEARSIGPNKDTLAKFKLEKKLRKKLKTANVAS